MLADILLTIPILLLFLAVAWRCLESCGLAPPEECKVNEPYTVAHSDTVKVFCFALAFRLFMLLAMFICFMLSGGENGLYGFPGQFTRWDARHYISLIEKSIPAIRRTAGTCSWCSTRCTFGPRGS